MRKREGDQPLSSLSFPKLKRVSQSSKKQSKRGLQNQLRRGGLYPTDRCASRDIFDLPGDSPLKETLTSKATAVVDALSLPIPAVLIESESSSVLEQAQIRQCPEELDMIIESSSRRRKVGRPKRKKSDNKNTPVGLRQVPNKYELRSSNIDSQISNRSTKVDKKAAKQQEAILLGPTLSHAEETSRVNKHEVNHQELQELSESQVRDIDLRSHEDVVAEAGRRSNSEENSSLVIRSSTRREMSSLNNDEEECHSKDGDSTELGDMFDQPKVNDNRPSLDKEDVGGIGSPENFESNKDSDKADESSESSAEDSDDTEVAKVSAAPFELFGEQMAWKEIMKAIKNIGMSRKNGIRTRYNLDLETDTVKEFVNRVKEVKDYYKELSTEDVTEGRMICDNLIQPEDLLERLEVEIGGLEERTVGTQASAVLQDIYVHAIPSLVYLLNQAVIARNALYSKSDDTKYLGEIIRLIEITTNLCQIARTCKAKPATTDVPFKNATRQIIFPKLRTIQTAFAKEFDKRHDELRQLRHIEAKARAEENALWKKQRKEEDKKLRIQERRRRIEEDILKFQPDFTTLRSLQGKSRGDATYPRYQPSVGDQWTKEQDYELIHQLRVFQNLPSILHSSCIRVSNRY